MSAPRHENVQPQSMSHHSNNMNEALLKQTNSLTQRLENVLLQQQKLADQFSALHADNQELKQGFRTLKAEFQTIKTCDDATEFAELDSVLSRMKII